MDVGVDVERICGKTSKRPSAEVRVVLDGKMWMCRWKKRKRNRGEKREEIDNAEI
jgi:hypothetical protein